MIINQDFRTRYREGDGEAESMMKYGNDWMLTYPDGCVAVVALLTLVLVVLT